MSDLVERLRCYNPPDRTVDDQRQIAVDISEAADRIEEIERELVVRTTAIANLHSLIDEMKKENAALKQEAERSTRRLVELSAPGSIGAFASRDHWKERAEKAEAENAALRAQIGDLELEVEAEAKENSVLRRQLESLRPDAEKKSSLTSYSAYEVGE